MENVNVAIIIGRLGKDPEIYSFQDGSYIVRLSIATSERWTDRNTGERKENTQWHQVVAWGVTAKVAFQNLKKGDLVYVEGSVRHNKSNNNGNTRIYTEIHAKQIYPI